MKAIGIAAILLMVAACGQVAPKPVARVTTSPPPAVSPSASPLASPSAAPTPAPSARPTPVPSPKVSPTLLFAVLEARGTANAWTYNTVAIAGLDGYARAKTTFTPMPVPTLACMGAIIPPSAHVAAGKVYFADGHGVVRSLGIDNKVATVATFPMTSTQQMLSFAVSPDGAHVIGTVFTVPTDIGACGTPSSGTYTFDAYTATGPTTAQLVYHQSSTTSPHGVLALTGWDAMGPFGTYPTVWASQGGGPGSTLGVFVRVDPFTLKPGAQFSDPSNCRVWDSVPSGTFVCMKDPAVTGGGTPDQRVNQPLSVRRADGTELWPSTMIGQNVPFAPYLSPDETHFAICCNDLDLLNSHEVIVGRDGSQVNLATGFYASGWLDATTVVGWTNSDIAYLATNSPNLAVSMGFSGQFVGTVRN